jgi:hypothetical protein
MSSKETGDMALSVLVTGVRTDCESVENRSFGGTNISRIVA